MWYCKFNDIPFTIPPDACGARITEWLMVVLRDDLAISGQVDKEGVVEFRLLQD